MHAVVVCLELVLVVHCAYLIHREEKEKKIQTHSQCHYYSWFTSTPALLFLSSPFSGIWMTGDRARHTPPVFDVSAVLFSCSLFSPALLWLGCCFFALRCAARRTVLSYLHAPCPLLLSLSLSPLVLPNRTIPQARRPSLPFLLVLSPSFVLIHSLALSFLSLFFPSHRPDLTSFDKLLRRRRRPLSTLSTLSTTTTRTHTHNSKCARDSSALSARSCSADPKDLGRSRDNKANACVRVISISFAQAYAKPTLSQVNHDGHEPRRTDVSFLTTRFLFCF